MSDFDSRDSILNLFDTEDEAQTLSAPYPGHTTPDRVPTVKFISNDGRRNDDGARVYEVQEIQARHHEMIRMKLLGLSNKDIGRVLGVTAQNVGDVLNSSIVRQHMLNLQASRDAIAIRTRMGIEDLAGDAVEAYKDILTGAVDASPKLKKDAAKDVLGILGFSPVVKVNAQTAHITATPEKLEQIKNRALEQARRNGKTIDADIVSQHSLESNET